MAFGNSIIARLGLDSRDFNSGIAGAQAQLRGFAGGSGGFGLGALSLGSLTAVGKEVIEYGDKINDLSERYGVNAVALQRLGNVAETEGSSLEGVAKGFNRLLINSSAALNGNRDVAAAFEALGITIEDLRSLSPEQIMVKIGKSSMDAASLVRVLGKAALELRPTLKAVAEGTKEFSAAISEANIKKLDEASDALKRFYIEGKVRAGTMLAQDFKDVEKFGQVLENVFAQANKSASRFYGSLTELSKGHVGEAIGDFKQFIKAQAGFIKVFKGPTSAAVEGAAELGGERGGPKSKAEIAAERKERDRLRFSLSELAEARPDDVEFRNNIQAVHAQRTAQEVQGLNVDARRQSLLYGSLDATAGRPLLDRADQMKAGIATLKDSELTGAFKSALDGSSLLNSIARSSVTTAQEMSSE